MFVQRNASTESIALVQIVSEGMGDAFVRLRLKDQAKSLDMITNDSQLSDLRQLRAPLVDYEVRGLPALTYFGGMVWRDAIDDYAQGVLSRICWRHSVAFNPEMWLVALYSGLGIGSFLCSAVPGRLYDALRPYCQHYIAVFFLLYHTIRVDPACKVFAHIWLYNASVLKHWSGGLSPTCTV